MAPERGSERADAGARPAGLRAAVWWGILGLALGGALHASAWDRTLLLALHQGRPGPEALWLFLTQLGDSALVGLVLLALAGAALGLALAVASLRSGEDASTAVLVDVEGHGRQESLGDADGDDRLFGAKGRERGVIDAAAITQPKTAPIAPTNRTLRRARLS